MMDARLRYYLTSRLNHYEFNARTDKFGILHYHLKPKNGGMSHSLSSMHLQRDLPATVHDYQTVEELAAHLLVVLSTGYKTVSQVFALAEYDPPRIHAVLFEDLSAGAGSRGEETTGLNLFDDENTAKDWLVELANGYLEDLDPSEHSELEEDGQIKQTPELFFYEEECRITYHKRSLS